MGLKLYNYISNYKNVNIVVNYWLCKFKSMQYTHFKDFT